MADSQETADTEPRFELSTILLVLKRILTFGVDSWKFTLTSAIIITILSIINVQYVMASWGVYGFSFDDSWIHVQYARTIFEGRPWEYAWGIPSTGSSGPLWSVVLSPIFLFGYDHDTVVTSVLVISGLFYIIDVFLVGEIVKQHTERWYYAILGQVIFVLVPRNAGLMLSGMETPLAMMVILLALLLLPRPDKRYDLVLGVLAGFAYLCRPEFVLLAALCLPIRSLVVLYKDRLKKERVLTVILMFVLAALVVLPWILHCYNTTGLPLPDSYYSKLRWGVSQIDIDYWDFYWYTAWLPLEPYLALGFFGGVILLLLKRRPYELILTTSLFVLYRLTMPGMSLLFAARYLVPLFDLLAVGFVCGLVLVIERMGKSRGPDIPANQELNTLLALMITFLLFVPSLTATVGYINIHANQASNIEDMQVTISEWIVENVPEGAVIGTYDVGAIGYFTNGTVLDIYGLVTPALLHDYTNLTSQVEYLEAMNCTYIVFYVEWFGGLRWAIGSRGGTVIEVFRAHLVDNVVCGSDNMAVYQIGWST
ncbi:MAG: hypothetical protein JW779_02030 [Candidatus Thorarchaeota archaeon]|nr:hypothetical protein [Candidatus Thorarchaeota archaeon]